MKGRVHPGVAGLPAYHRRAEERATRQLSAFVKRDGPDLEPNRVHCVQGEPEDVLSELVQAHGVDLVVMGSTGRVGLTAALLGERAEEILNRLECPVLIVKPNGFVTPLSERLPTSRA